jgi:hypothetical protein
MPAPIINAGHRKSFGLRFACPGSVGHSGEVQLVGLVVDGALARRAPPARLHRRAADLVPGDVSGVGVTGAPAGQETERAGELLTRGAERCPSHSRFFYWMRFHLLAALDGTPRAATLWSPERGEREVATTLLARRLHGGETVIADKGYAGAEVQAAAAELGATIIRPNRKAEPGQAPIISGVRQRVESIIQTTKGTLGLERHGARTLNNLRVRICVRLLALAACITLNHQLGLPSRNLVRYTT